MIAGKNDTTKGRTAAPVYLPGDRGAEYVIGIDLGGTKIRAGIAAVDGTILAERKVPTGADGTGAVEMIKTVIDDLCDDIDADAQRIAATGIGGAGVPDEAGTSFELAPNLTGLSRMPFAERLAAALGHPVVLENDVNVAAIGELHYGLGRDRRNFVYVAIGTGIGMGIIANGQLVRGTRGAAGEIGYLPVGADPLDPSHWVRGPLEEVTAGDAITRRYRLAAAQELSTREILQRAGNGDSAALAAFDEEARWIAVALCAVKAVLDPELVILGGGIGSLSALLPPLHTWLERYGAPDLDIRISELGNRAPIAGAIQLALETISATQKGLTQ